MSRCRTAVWLPVLLAVALAQPVPAVEPGALQPPTSPRFADVAWYDVQDVQWVTGGAAPVALDVVIAAIDPMHPLLQPVIELYLLAEDGLGRTALPGSGVAPPERDGWRVAVRIAGGRAWAWVAQPGLPSAPRPVEMTVFVPERTLRLTWASLPTDGRWVAITGVYDPFAADAWRPFAATASPWAFARSVPGPSVVDVWPGDADTWSRVVATGRLPAGSARPTADAPSGTHWWWWMGLGMALALAGWAWRAAPWIGRRIAIRAGTLAASTPAAAVLIGDDEVPATEGSDLGASTTPEHDEATLLRDTAAAAVEDGSGAAAARELAPAGGADDPVAQRGVPGDAGTATAPSDATSDAASDPARVTDAPSDESRSAKRS